LKSLKTSVGFPYFSRDLENLSPNLFPNLSLALSYKEREAEYIFLFGEALNSPPSVQKKAKHPLSSLLPGGNEGGGKGAGGLGLMLIFPHDE